VRARTRIHLAAEYNGALSALASALITDVPAFVNFHSSIPSLHTYVGVFSAAAAFRSRFRRVFQGNASLKCRVTRSLRNANAVTRQSRDTVLEAISRFLVVPMRRVYDDDSQERHIVHDNLRMLEISRNSRTVIRFSAILHTFCQLNSASANLG